MYDLEKNLMGYTRKNHNDYSWSGVKGHFNFIPSTFKICFPNFLHGACVI